MSNAGLQWTKFREQVVSEKSVYTFEDEGDWLVFKVRGQGVMPFWSSRSRAERIRKYKPERFEGWSIIKIDLDHFLKKVLPGMEEDGFQVGVNWAGKRMVGYDCTPAEVAEAIRVMQELKSEREA